jgi:hypothetical protein
MTWLHRILSPHHRAPLPPATSDPDALAARLTAEIDLAASEEAVQEARRNLEASHEGGKEHRMSRGLNHYGLAIDSHYRRRHGHGPTPA